MAIIPEASKPIVPPSNSNRSIVSCRGYFALGIQSIAPDLDAGDSNSAVELGEDIRQDISTNEILSSPL
jgi:hypothetical protein